MSDKEIREEDLSQNLASNDDRVVVSEKNVEEIVPTEEISEETVEEPIVEEIVPTEKISEEIVEEPIVEEIVPTEEISEGIVEESTIEEVAPTEEIPVVEASPKEEYIEKIESVPTQNELVEDIPSNKDVVPPLKNKKIVGILVASLVAFILVVILVLGLIKKNEEKSENINSHSNVESNTNTNSNENPSVPIIEEIDDPNAIKLICHKERSVGQGITSMSTEHYIYLNDSLVQIVEEENIYFDGEALSFYSYYEGLMKEELENEDLRFHNIKLELIQEKNKVGVRSATDLTADPSNPENNLTNANLSYNEAKKMLENLDYTCE